MVYEPLIDTMQTSAAGTEGGRRPTGVPAAGGEPNFPPGELAARHGSASPPNPEVVEKPQRRRFTKAYKLDILRQADACSGGGQCGALLRREGLYASHLANWRFQRSQGLLDNAARKKRVPQSTDPNGARVSQLERENARLKDRLRQAELVLDIQKKASEILGIPLKTLDNEGSDL